MKNIFRLTAAVAVALGLLSGPAVAGELTLKMQNGRVTIVARDVPVRQILQEWARVGQTRIVNVEKLAGPLVSLELVDVPEAQALEILLRSASGYMVARRPVPLPGASEIDRIMILPTSRATMAASTTPPPAMTPMVQAPVVDDDDDDEPNDAVQQAGQQMAPQLPGGATAVPVVRPPEVTFDYANPQNNPLLNPQLAGPPQNVPMQQGITGGAQVPGMPSTAQPGQMVPAPTTTRPGVMVPVPPQPYRNPYGLPTGVRPGSVQAPPTEPDRSKYANPPPPPE
jgi:hypothetical protein